MEDEANFKFQTITNTPYEVVIREGWEEFSSSCGLSVMEGFIRLFYKGGSVLDVDVWTDRNDELYIFYPCCACLEKLLPHAEYTSFYYGSMDVDRPSTNKDIFFQYPTTGHILPIVVASATSIVIPTPFLHGILYRDEKVFVIHDGQPPFSCEFHPSKALMGGIDLPPSWLSFCQAHLLGPGALVYLAVFLDQVNYIEATIVRCN